MKTEPKPSGVYPVFCQTPAARCIDTTMLLGYAPRNTPIRCPLCGRWSEAQGSQAIKDYYEAVAT